MTKLYTDYVELYDLAFAWDIEEEVDWLLSRLGDGCRSVLEPGCGTGRYIEAFERRGIEALGFDNSPSMVEAASRRGTAVLADMAAFDLGREFDEAVCAVNTFSHLAPADAARHLACLGGHLVPGARNLLQVSIRDPDDPEGAIHSSTWELPGVRATWSIEQVDFERRVGSRIESRGQVVEEIHLVTVWTPKAFADLVDASPFELTASYDGGQEERPRVDPGQAGRLLWHELARS